MGTETSTAIVETIAQREGTSPTELSPPLYDVLDPDALDRLVDGAGAGDAVEVTFEYAGYVVTARSDGDVRAVPVDNPEPHA